MAPFSPLPPSYTRRVTPHPLSSPNAPSLRPRDMSELFGQTTLPRYNTTDSSSVSERRRSTKPWLGIPLLITICMVLWVCCLPTHLSQPNSQAAADHEHHLDLLRRASPYPSSYSRLFRDLDEADETPSPSDAQSPAHHDQVKLSIESTVTSAVMSTARTSPEPLTSTGSSSKADYIAMQRRLHTVSGSAQTLVTSQVIVKDTPTSAIPPTAPSTSVGGIDLRRSRAHTQPQDLLPDDVIPIPRSSTKSLPSSFSLSSRQLAPDQAVSPDSVRPEESQQGRPGETKQAAEGNGAMKEEARRSRIRIMREED